MRNSRAAPFNRVRDNFRGGETTGAGGGFGDLWQREYTGARKSSLLRGRSRCKETTKLSGASEKRGEGEKREKGQLDGKAMENSRRWDVGCINGTNRRSNLVMEWSCPF
jgi:hypothetical protein